MRTRESNKGTHPGYAVTGIPKEKGKKQDNTALARDAKKAEAAQLAQQHAEASAELLRLENSGSIPTTRTTRAKARAAHPPIPDRSFVPPPPKSKKGKGTSNAKGKRGKSAPQCPPTHSDPIDKGKSVKCFSVTTIYMILAPVAVDEESELSDIPEEDPGIEETPVQPLVQHMSNIHVDDDDCEMLDGRSSNLLP